MLESLWILKYAEIAFWKMNDKELTILQFIARKMPTWPFKCSIIYYHYYIFITRPTSSWLTMVYRTSFIYHKSIFVTTVSLARGLVNLGKSSQHHGESTEDPRFFSPILVGNEGRHEEFDGKRRSRGETVNGSGREGNRLGEDDGGWKMSKIYSTGNS